MPRDAVPHGLTLREVERREEAEGVERLRLVTDAGDMEGRLHLAAGDAAVLWVFGAGGGLGGPAGGVYARLGERLRPRGVASLELDYRQPGQLRDCVQDALLGLGLLASGGKRRVALVGHSFGGAVVVNAGAVSDAVVAVAALSSQTAGTTMVAALAPKPVLFIHGDADEVLPASCSRDLHARAGEPKRLILYPGCRHGLDQCREALDRDLTAWLEEVLGLGPDGAGGA